jgi:glycosyltransferase involved in cell wall biosynthesis
LITVPSDYSKNILLKYNPKISNKLVKFPNLLDPSKFSSIYSDLRRNNSKNIVLTVANIKRSNIDRKGLKYFIRAAKLLPDIDFYVVGGFYDNSIKLLRNLSPQNVYFTGAVYGDELLRMYNRADVYCQLSKSESFGMALAESMLCECVPIVSNKGALPEVVGDSGFFVKESAPEEISENILKALDSKSGKKARDQILDNFSITKKKDDLIKLFLQFGVTP